MNSLKNTAIAIAGANDEHLLGLTHQFEESQFLLYGVGDPVVDSFNGTYIACEDHETCARKAVEAAAKGSAQVLMKGLVQTSQILHHVLKRENNLFDRSKLLSHISKIEINQRTIFLSDAAMNIAPTQEQLIRIIDNAIAAVSKLNVKHPKVALISAAETINTKMQSSVLASDITQYYTNQSVATVFGPLSLDLALSADAAHQKKFEGPIAGDADVLIVPFIEVGNVLYKSLTLFTDASVSGVILGANIPIALTSRADSIQSKIDSLEFALRLSS